MPTLASKKACKTRVSAIEQPVPVSKMAECVAAMGQPQASEAEKLDGKNAAEPPAKRARMLSIDHQHFKAKVLVAGQLHEVPLVAGAAGNAVAQLEDLVLDTGLPNQLLPVSALVGLGGSSCKQDHLDQSDEEDEDGPSDGEDEAPQVLAPAASANILEPKVTSTNSQPPEVIQQPLSQDQPQQPQLALSPVEPEEAAELLVQDASTMAPEESEVPWPDMQPVPPPETVPLPSILVAPAPAHIPPTPLGVPPTPLAFRAAATPLGVPATPPPIRVAAATPVGAPQTPGAVATPMGVRTPATMILDAWGERSPAFRGDHCTATAQAKGKSGSCQA